MISRDLVEIMVAQVKKVAFRARRPDLKGSIYYVFYYVSYYVLLRFYYVFPTLRCGCLARGALAGTAVC